MNSGWGELVTGANPVAGQPFRYRSPGETWTGIVAVRVTLTTSATVANRYPLLEIRSGDGTVVARSVSATALVASSVRAITWVADWGVTAFSPGGEEMLTAPSMLIPPGFDFRIGAIALDATDAITGLSLYVRRIPSGEAPDSPGSQPYWG